MLFPGLFALQQLGSGNVSYWETVPIFRLQKLPPNNYMKHPNLHPVTDVDATEEATRRSSRRSACRPVAPPVAGGDICRSSWALACGWTARIICCTSWKSFSLWEFTTDLNSSRRHILWRSELQTLDNKYPSAHSSAVSGQKIDSWQGLLWVGAVRLCC